MADRANNCFLINAPAGSGKTTEIKLMVQRCIINNAKDNILCVTYTNRAADELSKDILSKNVFIGTIHSFLNSFLKPFYAHQEIIKLYFEIFGEQISELIANIDQKNNIVESTARFIEKHVNLHYDTVKNNIKVLSYNESPFSSLYYGGLSHDDLIIFSKAIFDRYPVIGKKITSKYQYVFIDEYQDTMSDVLKFFFESITNTKTKLYLFGDRMQQIYKNYDGSFEGQFELFDRTKALTINYRSSKNIVEILNRIYNDPSFVQSSPETMGNTESDFYPRILFSHDTKASIEELRKTDTNTLVLYLFNKERFSDIDAISLFEAFDSMERYSFGRAYSAVDVLTESYLDNPDALLKLLFCIVDLAKLYDAQQYGRMIQIMKKNRSIFSKDSWNIQTHSDKEKTFNRIKPVFSILRSDGKTIADLISYLADTHLLNETYLSGIVDDEDYRLANPVPIAELVHVADYLNNPRVSTQHGVKGESHDSIVFVAEDSPSNPRVAMYSFFEMWGQVQVSAKSLNQFYYDFLSEVGNIQRDIGLKVSDFKKDTYKENEETIKEKIHTIYEKYRENPYFQFIYGRDYESYLSKPGVTKAKDCLKENAAYGILSAYKLFYVGCSRARRNLTILLDSTKIKGDVELQKKRFAEIGFQVIE